MAAKWLQDYAPEHIMGLEILFLVVGHSFLPPDRVSAKIEKEIKNREVIPSPAGLFANVHFCVNNWVSNEKSHFCIHYAPVRY